MPKGEIILLEGEKCPGLFVVKSGAVKLYRSSPEGDELIVRIMRSGGCFECAPLFDKGPNPVSAQALEESQVYLIPASDFESLFTTHPEAAWGIVPILAMRLRSFLNMVEDFSFRRVYSRLAKLLLQLGEGEGKVSSESPSQRKLVREGIIKMERRRIVILKPEALRKIVAP